MARLSRAVLALCVLLLTSSAVRGVADTTDAGGAGETGTPAASTAQPETPAASTAEPETPTASTAEPETPTASTTPTTTPKPLPCSSSPCMNGGVCTYVSDTEFKCQCPKGWTNTTCDKDVDECQETPCTGTGSVCNNNDGGHVCVCAEGYTTNVDGSCKVNILMEQFTNTTLYKRVVAEEKTPTEQAVPILFPMWGKNYEKIKIFKDGFLTFGNLAYYSEIPTKKNWQSIPPVLSVYASNMDFDDSTDNLLESGVWIYEDTSRLSNPDAPSLLLDHVNIVVNDNFKPLWALVVTWALAKPVSFPEERATAQVVLATDGRFSYAILIYDEVWADTQLANNPSVTTAYTDSNGAYTEIDPPSMSSVVKLPLFTKATSDDSNYQCLKSVNEVSQEVTTILQALPTCPCLKTQAELDMMFESVEIPNTSGCFTSLFDQSNMKQMCCYSPSGLLIEDEAQARTPTGNAILESAYTKCCEGGSTLCDRFYSHFPTSNCSLYEPPLMASGFGDPHLNTLTRQLYTVNGLGEYLVFNITFPETNRFVVLQGRMEINNFNGSVFTAYALKLSDFDDVYEAYIASDNTLQGNWTTNNHSGLNDLASIKEDFNQSSVHIAVKDGLFISISMLEEGNSLMHEVSISTKQFNSQGLVGANVPGEEFILRNGTKLPHAPSFQELDAFLESWRVVEKDSLFSYEVPDSKTYNETNDPNYNSPTIPTTVDAVLAAFTNDTLKTLASEICKEELFCLQSFLINEDIDQANRTLNEWKRMEERKTTLEAKQLEIIIGQEQTSFLILAVNWSLSIVGEGDPTFSVDYTGLDGSVSKPIIDGSHFIWNISSDLDALRQLTYPISVKITAKLGKSIGEASPLFVLCLCEECDSSDLVSSEGGNVVPATCPCRDPSKTGQYCTVSKDLCATCFVEETCNETLADYCAECPSGYEGNGVTCREIDECATNNGGCSDVCTNIDGSFECTCQTGYELKGNTTCTDIDECAGDTVQCPDGSYCVNDPGTSHCECYPNFEKIGGTCTKIAKTFVGTLELEVVSGFQEWSENLLISHSPQFEALASKVEETITNILAAEGTTDILVKVLTFKLNLRSNDTNRARRAATTSTKDTITATFVVYAGSTGNVELLVLKGILQTAFACPAGQTCSQNSLFIFGNGEIVAISIENLCDLPDANKCKPSTTNCEMNEDDSGYTCKCVPGTQINPLDIYTCDDIDECTSVTNCTNCQNTFRSYTCDCAKDGYVWNDETHVCEESTCFNNPCQHDGVCSITQMEPFYICRCSGEYEGVNCEDTNSEFERLRIAVICVSVILGVFCLFLLIILITVCVKHRRSVAEQSYSGSSSSRSYDYAGLPRPKVTDTPMTENGRNDYDTLESASRRGNNHYDNPARAGTATKRNVYENQAYDGERL